MYRTAGVIVSTGPCTDIVQLGLSESTASAVYTAAKYAYFKSYFFIQFLKIKNVYDFLIFLGFVILLKLLINFEITKIMLW